MTRAPRRTCVGCRTTRAKPELWRVVVTPTGAAIDPTQTLPGRGAYVCPDLRCVERLERGRGQQLHRALRTADTQTTTDALTEIRTRLEDEPPEMLETAEGGPETARSPAQPASHPSDTARSTTT